MLQAGRRTTLPPKHVHRQAPSPMHMQVHLALQVVGCCKLWKRDRHPTKLSHVGVRATQTRAPLSAHTLHLQMVRCCRLWKRDRPSRSMLFMQRSPLGYSSAHVVMPRSGYLQKREAKVGSKVLQAWARATTTGISADGGLGASVLMQPA